jgi:carbonic anhydrase
MTRIYKAIKDPKPKAIIIRCSDPRFRIAFRDFAVEELGLNQGEFVPINVAGGPAALAHYKTKVCDFNYLMHQIVFFIKNFESIQKIIIIGHQDCGYYKTIINHPDMEDKEKKDLPRAARIISKIKFRDIKIESYYARFTDENHAEIIFEKIG